MATVKKPTRKTAAKPKAKPKAKPAPVETETSVSGGESAETLETPEPKPWRGNKRITGV